MFTYSCTCTYIHIDIRHGLLSRSYVYILYVYNNTNIYIYVIHMCKYIKCVFEYICVYTYTHALDFICITVLVQELDWCAYASCIQICTYILQIYIYIYYTWKHIHSYVFTYHDIWGGYE